MTTWIPDIPPEGWIYLGSVPFCWACSMAWKMWDHYHPIKWAWCSGCDELQPSACFRWNTIGLYRCGNCIEDPKLLDQAREIEAGIPPGDFPPVVPAFRPGAQF